MQGCSSSVSPLNFEFSIGMGNNSQNSPKRIFSNNNLPMKRIFYKVELVFKESNIHAHKKPFRNGIIAFITLFELGNNQEAHI